MFSADSEVGGRAEQGVVCEEGAEVRLLVEEDHGRLSQSAARLVARQVLAEPRSVLALPTGETPKDMYAALARLAAAGLVDLSGVTVFNLDEYLGLPEDDPRTFRSYMQRHLWERIPQAPAAWHIPRSRPEDEHAECAGYEQALEATGGVHLAVLGIGDNGHIAFAEPGTPFESRVHVAELSEASREQAADDFGGVEQVPRRAVTMGIKTIMHAQEVLLLVSGGGKTDVLARALEGPVTTEVPASVLQLHPRLTVVADAAAASTICSRNDTHR